MNLSPLALLTVMILTSPILVASTYDCDYEPSTVNVISSTAASAADLTPSFEAFRFLLGGENNGNDNGNVLLDGHRQINWDAAPVPFDMPPDFFASRVTRGCLLSSEDDEFVVSNPPDGSDDLFDSIDPSLKQDFVRFSDNRLFAALNDIKMHVTFVLPSDTNVPASVSGFGAVFVDVDKERETKMEFFDVYGCKLATEYVPVNPSGLSFVGVDFGDDSNLIALVKLTLGTSSLSGENDQGATKKNKKKDKKSDKAPPRDVVVLDDFIYSEPQAI